MKKICFYLTTRGNYGKTKSIIDYLKNNPEIELQFIMGGGFPFPYNGYSITMPIAGTHDEIINSTVLITSEITNYLRIYHPDLIVIVADRFECLPVAMIAAYMNIPIAHIEGGELSGSIDESIRHAITKLAHIHFPASKDAADRLIQMGENPDNVHCVGATSFDMLLKYSEDKPILNPPYLIAILHPVSSQISGRGKDIEIFLDALFSLEMETVIVQPNKDINSFFIIHELSRWLNPNFHIYESIPIQQFASLMKHASCMIGNSSSGIRECPFLGTPSVNIGNRQDNRESSASVIHVPFDKMAIIEAVKKQIAHGPYEADFRYGDGHAGEKIAKILETKEVDIQKKFWI